ncbi:MAG TPA: alpha/beta fold hydrolase [Vicinamibacterales bacterium]|nr:alpha/beta fold hydrolase [Vicinamibacterales bacterium]
MTDSPWLARFAARPNARLRLLCFPPAGGSAAAFGQWPDLVGADIEIVGIEYPGRGSRRAESLFVRIQALVSAMVMRVQPELGDMPFAILGHSLGALLGFELARHLRLLKGPLPVALCVCGCRAPSLPARKPPSFGLGEAEFLGEVRSLNGTAPEVLADPNVFRLFEPALRADFEMAETYVCRTRPPLDLPILAYGGADDRETLPDELHPWSRETTSPLTLRFYSGDHFFLREAASAVARDVSRDLLCLLDGQRPAGMA